VATREVRPAQDAHATSAAASSPAGGSSPESESRHSSAGSQAIVRYAPRVIIGLLLVAVIAGIRAAGPAVAGRGPLRQDALAIAVGLGIALIGLQVALVIRIRRSPRAGPLASKLRAQLRFLTTLAMTAIIVIVAVNLVASRSGSTLLRVLAGRPKPLARRAAKHIRLGSPLGSVNASHIAYAVLALVVLAAIAICVALIARMRKGIPGGYAAGIADDDSDELRKAVESGAAALRAFDDARAAIIACYVAMEGSLAGAGAARRAAETPDELLARAVASGLIHGPAAASLTALFYEARFSSHRLADSAKHDARQALDAISAELHSKRSAAGQHNSAPDSSAQQSPARPRLTEPGPVQRSQATGRTAK
jgi:hypothetical protein